MASSGPVDAGWDALGLWHPEARREAVAMTREAVEAIVTEVMRRLRFRESLLSRSDTTKQIRLLTYKQAGEIIGGKSAGAVKQMVRRKQLKAAHPNGGRSAYIDSRDLEAYINSARFGGR